MNLLQEQAWIGLRLQHPIKWAVLNVSLTFLVRKISSRKHYPVAVHGRYYNVIFFYFFPPKFFLSLFLLVSEFWHPAELTRAFFLQNSYSKNKQNNLIFYRNLCPFCSSKTFWLVTNLQLDYYSLSLLAFLVLSFAWSLQTDLEKLLVSSHEENNDMMVLMVLVMMMMSKKFSCS